jgi:hypothetical protein
MPDNDVKENTSKKAAWAIALMQGIGALFAGLMGVSFILLAFYLFYTEYRAAETFRVKFLMMPMMNILISSMLLFYSRLLYFKAKATRRAILNGTFVSPRIIVTRYDIVAILAFILVVALISYFLIR